MANEKMIEKTPRSNVPEMSVSELAFSLKRTLEETYGRVRIRGELSRVKIHTSGHLYSDLKDESAVVNLVCWKGTVAKLSIKPEEGLEVICIGCISTYPARSNYQLIVESMELAGEGALLKMLEERKKKLSAEGLFATDRKQKLPFLPKRIGVITSPTGAVIRDIMHRLNDRFPRHVLLWPVLVQGPGAAEQITEAIDGFNKLDDKHRPDLLIVARGGGSLEDLMAFNEENVVRAAADSTIPLISAVGHETDTTLIDYAADIRAPTPTGAAEMAVPRRIDLMAQIADDEQRLISSMSRRLTAENEKLRNIGARLGEPSRLLETKAQTLDHLSHKMTGSFEKQLSAKQARTAELAAMLRHPQTYLNEQTRNIKVATQRLHDIAPRLLNTYTERLASQTRMLESLSFKSVLNRGYVVVRDEKGKAITAADKTRTGQNVQLQFKDDRKIDAIIGKKPKTTGKAKEIKEQGQLF